ncbi:cytoglobin-like [Convolutriloba macropyga]|uniref:cytoglobin-like n=1 Tax=Convolutriloba macropyga TaxID=536237 RepID=UPI003F51B59B
MKFKVTLISRRKKLSPKESSSVRKSSKNSSEGNREGGAPTTLSWNEKRLVRKSWKKAEKVVVEAGVDVFISMFEKYPESKQYFHQFRDLSSPEAFRNNLLLRAHNIHVINMIDQVVRSMHNKSLMDAIIVDTGKRHFNRHVTIQLLQFFGPEYARSLSRRGNFDTRTLQSWHHLFAYIVALMVQGVEEKTECNQKWLAEEAKRKDYEEKRKKYFSLRENRGRSLMEVMPQASVMTQASVKTDKKTSCVERYVISDDNDEGS